MKRISNSKVVGEVQLGTRTIYVTRDSKLHVGVGSGPMPTDAEILAAVRAETDARRAQSVIDNIMAKKIAASR